MLGKAGRPLAVLIVLLLGVGPAAAQLDVPLSTPLDAPEDASGCDVETTPALTVLGATHWGRTYVDATLPMAGGSMDFYVESNEVAGLQREPSPCEDGSEIPPDLCVSKYGTSLTYCARMLPFTLTP